MTSDDTVRVPAEGAERLAGALLEAAGLTADDAAIAASHLVLADLRGVDTHGLMRLPVYLERLERAELRPEGELAIVSEAAGSATVDGRHGLGQVISHKATMLAIEKAREVGVGAVAIRNSSHFGAAAGYPMLAAEHQCIGMATTNAWPLLPAVGGTARVVGNNPLAIGAPTRLGYPMVLDIAMSHVAAGHLRIAAAAGRAVPPDWAFDRHGEPTTDPEEALFGGGFLRPMGDHKGFGLALMMDVLSGVLSGGAFGPQVSGLDDPGYMHVGHFILALDIDTFVGVEGFLDHMDALVEHVHASPTREDVDGALVPGELEARTTSERRQQGIPYPRRVHERLLELADAAGVAVPDAASPVVD